MRRIIPIISLAAPVATGDWRNSYDFGIGYCLAHRHIQLAPKYSRLGNIYQEYLTRLTAAHSVTCSGNKLLMIHFSTLQASLSTRWQWRGEFYVKVATIHGTVKNPYIKYIIITTSLGKDGS